MSNTNTYDKSFPVSWEEIHRNSKALAWRLSELKPYKGIIAVTRGGLVPAAIVARELDIRLIDTFCVLSYNQKTKGDVKVLKEDGSEAKRGEMGDICVKLPLPPSTSLLCGMPIKDIKRII